MSQSTQHSPILNGTQIFTMIIAAVVAVISAFALIGCGEKNESGAGAKLMFFS